jgi:hypothetical protein
MALPFVFAMFKKILLVLTFFARIAGAKPVHLRVEHLDNPLGIDVLEPRFSWRADSTERNWRIRSSLHRAQPR